MNLEKLEELHYNITANNSIRQSWGLHADLTADVAVKFAEWIYQDGTPLPSEKSFDYFINNIYKPE